MSLFRWETHAHTAEISPCGKVPAADAVRLYIDAGYTGMVITDHLSEAAFRTDFVQKQIAGMPWEQQIDWYCGGYEAAVAAAEGRLSVLFGAELRFLENTNDYLVYGMTPAWLKAHPDLFRMTLREFSEIARAEGFLLVQAHPFRNGITVMNPALLDGIEVQNGNPRHDSRNGIAKQWAARHGLLATAGSDFHQTVDAARSGILTAREIRTMADFIAAVREGVQPVPEKE